MPFFEGDLARFVTKLAEHLNPRLVAINGSKKGTTFPLTADQITIGRESTSVVSLNHASVSRRHCVIEREGDNFKIRDLGSSNGTFVNGQPVNDKVLNHADQVRIGSIALLFLLEETDDATSDHLVRFDDSQPINESAKQLRPESLLHQTEVVVDLSEHERLTRDLGVLVKIGTRISRLRRTQELVREILDSIFDVVPVDRGAIRSFDSTRRTCNSSRPLPAWPRFRSRTRGSSNGWKARTVDCDPQSRSSTT